MSEPPKKARLCVFLTTLIVRRCAHPALQSGQDVYAYFKNEETPQGATYAVELLKQVPSGG